MKTVVVQSQQKWEHMAITRRSDPALVEESNVLGQDGWEMVTVLYYKDMKGTMAWTAFYKRPSSGQPVKPAGHAAVYEPQTAAPTAEHGNPPGFEASGDTFDLRPE